MSDEYRDLLRLNAPKREQLLAKLDASGDKRSMNKMARRLGKEQPALLQFAAQHRDEHGEQVGEAAVFYGTLVWAMFARNYDGTVPRLLPDNLSAAEEVVKAMKLALAVDGVEQVISTLQVKKDK